MAFDGSYPRPVRERGVVHRIFVRRARCRACGQSEALRPDFLLARRLDSAASIAAALLRRSRAELPEAASHLYDGVPARTVRSWQQRFSEVADEVAALLSARCAEWGDIPPRPPATASDRAVQAMGAAWRAACRHRWDVPPAFMLANLILGGELLASRVDLPRRAMRRRAHGSRAP